jgi:putative ABC transport system permease protein
MNKRGLLLRETVNMSFASLGAHKLRTFLTVIGITIGVFSVIGVMTAVSALRGSIESGLSFLGANTFQFGKMPIGIQVNGNDRAKYNKRKNVTLAQAQRYQELMAGYTESVCLKVFLRNGTAQAEYAGRKTTPALQYGGTNENFLTANQYAIDLGRNFTPGDVALGSPVAIIGPDVVAKLFPAESPLNKMIKVNGLAYTVIGTYVAKGSSFGQSQDGNVMVPITRFLRDNGADQYTVNIATEAPSPDLYYESMDKGLTAMRIARGLKPAEENDFELYSNDSLLEAFAKVADAVRAGAFIISAIALAAAGVGIMNIMLVSVTERTKEIGVRKSIGARQVNILSQFLLEAVAISLIGGVGGILLGVAAGDALALLLHAGVVFPWGWAIAGLVVCSGIGIGFGFYPALKAAGLDPIEALRYE